MEKQKRWQFAVILTVIILTLYNILPTVIFYTKPLRAPITVERAEQIEHEIAERVNALEKDSEEWISSFCDLIHVKPKNIQLHVEDASCILVDFETEKEAALFRKFLPRAGIEIPFLPSQLAVVDDEAGTSVTVLRRQGFHFRKDNLKDLFQFSMKRTESNEIAPLYYEIARDRIMTLALAICDQPLIEKVKQFDISNEDQGSLTAIAQDIVTCEEAFSSDSPITKRYISTLGLVPNFKLSVLLSQLDTEMKKLETRIQELDRDAKQKEENKELQSQEQQELSDYLKCQLALLGRAKAILAKYKGSIVARSIPSKDELVDMLRQQAKQSMSIESTYSISLAPYHPLISELIIDWANDAINIRLYKDVLTGLNAHTDTEQAHRQQEALSRLVLNEIARISQSTQEKIASLQGEYQVMLSKLPDAKSFLILQLPAVGAELADQTLQLIQKEWMPQHQDFQNEQFPRVDEVEYAQLPIRDKKLCLTVFNSQESSLDKGLKPGSIYVILRGVKNIMEQYQKTPESSEAKTFEQDFVDLSGLLYKRGFIGYPGGSIESSFEWQNDYIFELADFYNMLLKATRESFYALGSKNKAILEFSDVEQRIITLDKIEDAIQEDLLRWREAYDAAQVDLNKARRYTVPKPTKNAFFENVKLATRKYFRGDDRKILRWGLDLSGGKSVRIALVDQAGNRVESQTELTQAVDELYTRINKMGVSERTIRIENTTILLDFPGSQALSAQELIKASSMYFHVVNEKFGPLNQTLSKEVHEFLQEVWNEAVVTNRIDDSSLNEIAYQKLEDAQLIDSQVGTKTFGLKSAARVLYEHGLRLAPPKGAPATASFNDKISMIARFAADDAQDWTDQTHPLMIVYHNYALEGSSLENIQTGYDPSKGNMLLFGVRSSYAKGSMNQGGSPRDEFYAWTAPFSEEKILGTELEAYSRGHGWRMAVILNGVVINAPSLTSPLRDHAMITGHFSQREVSKLATDLAAGSLSFTPKILSEQNISPELGHAEARQSIFASCIAIALVVAMMCGYYHFAGLVASIAVLFNMLVIWAVMQNIDAVLTLPGIAGMVLTVGMAVDANVLVFERIREEFRISKRIASAIQAGYKKAFSAIFDSNITTILVALILLQFDCGPIRGFAMTLIIGITASMFTALFMTRYYFAGWVQNPSHNELTMREWFKVSNFDFLKKAKPAFAVSAVLFIVGVASFALSNTSMVGMDFTGGYSVMLELEEQPNGSVREAVSHALERSGLKSREFQIRELGRPNLIRLQLSTSLESEGRPFHNMPQELNGTAFSYAYQKNPRITWIVNAIDSDHMKLKPSSLETLDNSWTVMSGQFSDVMRNNAILALSFALIGVLIYITFRFEWKYAVSALVALLHDVLVTLAVAAIAHLCGAPIQINLELVGAIMMIIGYSLNDTIIVFDRIREDIRLYRKLSYPEIINLALNLTLGRTILTSSTTFIVLLALVLFGSSSLFGFAFVMMTGVFLGTFSSLFIACPILLYLHNRDQIEHARE